MPPVNERRLAQLLDPFLAAPAGQGGVLRQAAVPELLASLGRYLELLQAWNARTNLTSIRDPEEMAIRHFGESLFAARCLAPRLQPGAEVLDLGSGAGFPGLPLALLLPELCVTLAESQSKKAAFLREAVRTTASSAAVWSARTESMPPQRRFEAVAFRAVDRSALALEEARRLTVPGGWILQFLVGADVASFTALVADAEVFPMPAGAQGSVVLSRP
jgi:16S rRNA (guanine527-N7)-methyltransferase